VVEKATSFPGWSYCSENGLKEIVKRPKMNLVKTSGNISLDFARAGFNEIEKQRLFAKAI
jgi:hypothetical protein